MTVVSCNNCDDKTSIGDADATVDDGGGKEVPLLSVLAALDVLFAMTDEGTREEENSGKHQMVRSCRTDSSNERSPEDR